MVKRLDRHCVHRHVWLSQTEGRPRSVSAIAALVQPEEVALVASRVWQ